LTELDLQMLDWFAQTGKPIHILLSKADKLTRQEQSLAMREVQAILAKISDNCTLQLFSSLKKTGVAEAEEILGRWLEMVPKDEVVPPVGLRTEKVARPKNRKAIGWSARSAKK
jgi:GTP-binding protein